MKLKRHSLTLWFNWIVSGLNMAAGVIVVYLPQVGLSNKTLALSMIGLGLITTFSNAWLRIYKTKSGIGAE